jgi:hypothetical protein
MIIQLSQIEDYKNPEKAKGTENFKNNMPKVGHLFYPKEDIPNENLNNAKNWLPHVITGDYSSGINTMFCSIPENVPTFTGLISYLHYVWAKELGAQLRPDMIFFTIISTIADTVIYNSTKYKHLFNNSPFKTDIVLRVANPEEMNLDQLTNRLKELVVSKELIEIVTETSFKSEPEDAKIARQVVFANMASPFFNYFTTMCGIKHLDIVDSLEEWTHLYNQVGKLSLIFPDLTFLSESMMVISSIVHHAFNQVLDKEHQPYGSDKTEFFSDIFHYGKSFCGSGHDKYVVKGWARVFYGQNYKSIAQLDIRKYSSHVHYLCMKNIETNLKMCQAMTLSHGLLDENSTLNPQYGFCKFEVIDQQLYDKLSRKIVKISIWGEEEEKRILNEDEVKNILKKGKFYDSDGIKTFYPFGQGQIQFDICFKTANCSYRLPDPNSTSDICPECHEMVKKDFGFV